MAGITMSPQLRESPETANLQFAAVLFWPKQQDAASRQQQSLWAKPDCSAGLRVRANPAARPRSKLKEAGHADEETLGMLGRTFKDLASTAARPGDREHFLKRAAETYTEAYRLSKGPWSGINAATMMLLTGDNECARNLAQSVREQCLENVANSRGDLYWEFATLGEAALICRDYAQARDWYARAAEHARKRFADVQSSRRNARLILRHWNDAPDWIDNYLHVPSVIVFAGHMIDRPDRAAPRFPPELEPAVAKALHEALDKLKPGFGFSAAACIAISFAMPS